ncbi:MAG: response regulator [Telluria sp.]
MSTPSKQPAPRILIVDDNLDAADSLALLFSISGWDVAVAYSGPHALVRAEAFRPQLVFLDIGMPDMDGCETARRMRRQPWGAQAVIVALTAWSDEPTRRRVALAGMDHHLVKPVRMERVLDIVDALAG